MIATHAIYNLTHHRVRNTLNLCVSGIPLAVTLPTNRTRRPTKAFLPFKSILDREMDYPNQAVNLRHIASVDR